MRSPLSTLQGQRFDVIVISAGINGASGAQRLVAAGYTVLLVDKGDFGSGSDADAPLWLEVLRNAPADPQFPSRATKTHGHPKDGAGLQGGSR
jgi:choline dehydrogenase-like flavoprotein